MKKVGLVLEGGGMRGVFTAGILDFFLENDIEFEEIIGVSAGAIHGCNFKAKQKKRSINVSLDFADDKRYCSLYSLLTTGDMFGAKFVYYEIPSKLNIFDNDAFKNNKSRLIATVTNVETGKAEYMELKDMDKDIEIVRASASLPLISRMVPLKGRKYLDGGIADSIPVKEMERRGFSKNIVILTQPLEYRKEPSGGKALMKARYRKYPKFIAQFYNRYNNYNETLEYIEQQEKLGNIFVIRPKEKLCVDRIEKDKAKLQKTYELGYEVAKEQYEAIKKFME